MDDSAPADPNTSTLDAALGYAKLGLAVFPTAGKIPRTRSGFHAASTNEAQIREWWTAWPDAGIGLPTGARNGLVVVDVDDAEALEAFERDHGRLPATEEVITPRGGRHLYYRHPGGGVTVRSCAGFRGYTGLDVRADLAYVVVPPSPGYCWEIGNADRAELPAVFVEAAPHRTTRSDVDGERIRQGARNGYLTSLLGAARRRGATVSELEALGLTANAERCDPPLEEREVRAIAESVARYAPSDPPPDEIVSAAPMYASPAETKRRLAFRSAVDFAARTPPAPPWLLRGYVARGAITELVGKVKISGKTTLALDMCRAVLRGEPFAGRATERAGVVYLSEQPGVSFREALARADLLEAEGLTLLGWHDAIGVRWPEVAAQAIEECRIRGAGLLVVDTLGQWAGIRGDGENDAGEALRAMAPLQEAAGLHSLAVLVPRHGRRSGGEVGDDGRGSSASRAPLTLCCRSGGPKAAPSRTSASCTAYPASRRRPRASPCSSRRRATSPSAVRPRWPWRSLSARSSRPRPVLSRPPSPATS